MRFETAGNLRRVDLGPVLDLVPALRDQWASLRFNRDGLLINPLTNDTIDALALVDGRHRQAGAVYRITVTSPELELPEDRRTEFEKEARKLSQRNAKQAQWDDHFARRGEASVQVGTEEHHVAASLLEDNSRRLAFSVSHEDQRWTVEVDVDHCRLPQVRLNGRVDLTASFKAEGAPGCLASFLGGPGGGSAVLHLRTLEQGGRGIEAEGRAKKFRGSAQLDVQTSATRWEVVGAGTLRARGLGRLVLWFAGLLIRRNIDRSLAEFWASSDSHVAELEKGMARLRVAIEEEGGPAPFVRRALWDDDFDPGLELFRRDRNEP